MKYRHENVSQCDLNKFVRNLLKVYDKSFILGILFVNYFIKKKKKNLSVEKFSRIQIVAEL
jgi:hypothetical protein